MRLYRLAQMLLALLALWSLLVDTVVIRAHQHATPKFVTAQLHNAGASLDETCALCAATATLDVLLLPSAPSWQPPVAAAFVMPRAMRPARARYRRTHDWQSRAPPGSTAPR